MTGKNHKRKIDVKQSERALLTDTLPFELPIFFTNENFAVLAHAYRTNKLNQPFHERLLLVKDATPGVPTKPFHFEICRIAARGRKLSLPHPKSQHLMSLFYKKYEQFIVNACNRTAFSLRHPSMVATHYFEKKYVKVDNSPRNRGADEDPSGFRNQNLWASTYFSYRDYHLIYKFFDSDEFISLETRYPLLMRLDISRCFDSIYTHSIDWSMRGKEFAKEHLPSPRAGRTTFESTFDAVIRNANENETHGIIVGPESSRIFAEIILQSIDRAVDSEKSKVGLNVKIRRYVDDYYIFGSTEGDLDSSKELIRNQLLLVNLHLNDEKTSKTHRPFSSKTSAARTRASRAIDIFFAESIDSISRSDDHASSRKIEASRKRLLRYMRSVSVELELPYESFASFTLSILDRKLSEFLSTAKPDDQMVTTTTLLARQAWLLSCIRTAQLFFEIDCRVTTSLKLAGIYNSALSLAGLLSCSRAPLENQILDGLRNEAVGIATQLADEVTRINHICAVDALLTDGRKLNEADLVSYIGDFRSKIGNFSPFALLALLFLSRRRKRFADVRLMARNEIAIRVRASGTRLPTETEATLLLTDFIACPYLDDDEKVPVLMEAYQAVMGKPCSKEEARVILKTSDWISFTDWAGRSDIGRMLARRELTPPYEAS